MSRQESQRETSKFSDSSLYEFCERCSCQRCRNIRSVGRCSNCKCEDCANVLLCDDYRSSDETLNEKTSDDDTVPEIRKLITPRKRIPIRSLSTQQKEAVRNAARAAAPGLTIPEAESLGFCLVSLMNDHSTSLQTCHVIPQNVITKDGLKIYEEGEKTFHYAFLPFPTMKRPIMRRENNDLSEEASITNQVTLHYPPYDQMPILSSHVKPHFVLFNLASKLKQAGLDLAALDGARKHYRRETLHAIMSTYQRWTNAKVPSGFRGDTDSSSGTQDNDKGNEGADGSGGKAGSEQGPEGNSFREDGRSSGSRGGGHKGGSQGGVKGSGGETDTKRYPTRSASGTKKGTLNSVTRKVRRPGGNPTR
ncbi:hypothetical protein C0995_007335 [Termitomyces sp. Mi166|nr:hypothetical protein C0995_007335 [Termitomyces sp. Mi166\